MKQNGFTHLELITSIFIVCLLVMVGIHECRIQPIEEKNKSLYQFKSALESHLAMSYSKLAVLGLEAAPSASNYPTPTEANHFSPLLKKDDIHSLPFTGCAEHSPFFCEFQFGYPKLSSQTLSCLIPNLSAEGDKNQNWTTLHLHDAVLITRTDNTVIVNIDNHPKALLKKPNCYLRYQPAKKERKYVLTLCPCNE